MYRTFLALGVGAAAIAAYVAGSRLAPEPVRVHRSQAVESQTHNPNPLRTPEPADEPAPARPQIREWHDLEKLEEEWMARVIDDPAFRDALFAEFLAETDPMKMSFLQNVLASNPKLRNDPAWQDKFLTVAETDPSRERRITALLFVQQAEAIGSVRERMFALAETGDVRAYALVALAGLPDRRLRDDRLQQLAGRIAERDPELRGLALRIEGNPERAARFLSDPDREVRMQAAQVVDSREALEKAIAEEKDEEVRRGMEFRLASLR